MNPQHIAKLLNRSGLSPEEKAMLAPHKINNPPPTQTHHGYDPANDSEFESLDNAYAELCAAHLYGGSEFSPLSDLSQTPTGKIWLRCFSIGLLGGNAITAIDDTRALLPVLANTHSSVVRLKVCTALRSLMRNFPDVLPVELAEEMSKAVATSEVVQ
jgi:hypothetical protein